MNEDKLKQFNEDGFVVLEDFINEDEADKLRQGCLQLVEEMKPNEHRTVFSGVKQNYRDNYFINSADRIGYFWEEGALDESGNLLIDKHLALNKVGHALHVLLPTYRSVTHSDKVKEIGRSLGYVDAVIPQSMYIFKQPKIGGEVVSHQDATYLYTEPVRVVGVWIALEDATQENGCLSFIPGSHKAGVLGNYRMIRNPASDGPSCVYTGEKPTYDLDKFIPAPVKKGAAILIDGLVVHRSEHNHSDKTRHIYTFHMYDAANSKWSEQNWLQPTERATFTHLYEM